MTLSAAFDQMANTHPAVARPRLHRQLTKVCIDFTTVSAVIEISSRIGGREEGFDVLSNIGEVFRSKAYKFIRHASASLRDVVEQVHATALLGELDVLKHKNYLELLLRHSRDILRTRRRANLYDSNTRYLIKISYNCNTSLLPSDLTSLRRMRPFASPACIQAWNSMTSPSSGAERLLISSSSHTRPRHKQLQ